MSDKPIQKVKLLVAQDNVKGIIDVFSYSTNERETFPYIHRYMNLITGRLDELENNKEKLKRFALAGLFLTY